MTVDRVKPLFVVSILTGALLLLGLVWSGRITTGGYLGLDGLAIPAGSPAELTGPLGPEWGRTVLIRLRAEDPNLAAQVRLGWGDETELQGPEGISRGWAVFRLTRSGSEPAPLLGTLSGKKGLDPVSLRITNRLASNTGLPRFAVLFGGSPRAVLPLWAVLLISLVGGLVCLPGLVGFPGIRGRWWTIPAVLLLPGAALATALILKARGLDLVLGWDGLTVLALPGALISVTLVIEPRLRTGLSGLGSGPGSGPGSGLLGLGLVGAVLVPALIGLGLGTPLGLGPERFPPGYIYRPHMIYPALAGGALYLLLLGIAVRFRRPWLESGDRPFRTGLLLVFGPALLIYLAQGYTHFGGDNFYNCWLAFRLLAGEGVGYSPEQVAALGRGIWNLVRAGDEFLPVYPLAPGLFNLPAAILQNLAGLEPTDLTVGFSQKVTAAWLSGLAATFFFRAVRIMIGRTGPALFITAGFALGTTQATINGVGLWQHSPAVMLICMALLCLAKGLREDERWLPMIALPLAFLPLMRPQAGPLCLAGLALVTWSRPRLGGRFILWGLPGGLAYLAANPGLYGTFLGGYAALAAEGLYNTPLGESLAGVLISPNRGLFVFSPFLLLGLWGLGSWVRTRKEIALPLLLGCLGQVLVYGGYDDWHGGWCAGPRFLAEAVPVLGFGLAVWWAEGPTRIGRALAGLLIIISILINLPGSFFMHDQVHWNMVPNVDTHRDERAWSTKDWLPLHWAKSLGLARGRPSPAYLFAYGPGLETRSDPRLVYKLGLDLRTRGDQLLAPVPFRLEPGRYRLTLTGRLAEGATGRAEIVLELAGKGRIRFQKEFEPGSGTLLNKDFEVREAARLALTVRFFGQGRLVLEELAVRPLGRL